jgi:hypothetical protein
MSGPIGSSHWMYNAGGSFYPYSINQSLRFDGSSSTLHRTPSAAGNRRTWTWSCWFKRSVLNTYQNLFGTDYNTSGNYGGYIGILDNNKLRVYSNLSGSVQMHIDVDMLFRDVSSFYHLLVAFDSTEASAGDRVKVYVNGSLVTYTTTTAPALNLQGQLNDSERHDVGSFYVNNSPTWHWNGYMAEVYFIDGTALDPTSFGETINGVWVPKAYSGSYGTNGFYLSFADSSAIGDDLSGNTNDFTATNLAASDVVPDSPTNNFCTWNSLQPQGAAQTTNTLSEGNLKAGNNANAYGQSMGSMSVLSGKWYTETYINDTGYPSWHIGWTYGSRFEAFTGGTNDDEFFAGFGYFTGSNVYFSSFGTTYAALQVAYSGLHTAGDAPTTGDVIGCAADFDNGKFWWSINGEWVDVGSGAGDPANDSNPAQTYTVATYADYYKSPWVMNYNGSFILNAGQDSTFAGAITAGGNSDENGYGDFKYAPPSGFLALCSANLPELNIGPNSDEQADDYFNTVVYTGNGTAIASGGISVTGVNFQPDWVWLKSRTNAYDNMLFDSVRGPLKIIKSNSTAAEITSNTENLDSFDADGFTYGSELSGNASGASHVAWNWKAGGTAISNTDGSITSQVSAAPDAGFAVGTYTGNATAGATIGHSLGEIPEMVIVKRRTNARDWAVYHKDQSATPTNAYMLLNSTAAVGVGSTAWNNGTFTSSVFTIGSHELVNFSGDSYVFYAFRGIDGHSKCGSYVGNGSANGTFIYTGFRPAWVMVKGAGNTYSWYINDSTRDTFNHTDAELVANSSSAEYSAEGAGGGERSDFLSNGFKVRTSNVGWNQSGITYIYLAFAEQPFKYSNAR